MQFAKKILSIMTLSSILCLPIVSSAQVLELKQISEENKNVLEKLKDNPKKSFIKHKVKNNTQLLIYWGDVENNLTIEEASSIEVEVKVSSEKGRLLALKGIKNERNDSLASDRLSNELNFESTIKGGIDGAIIVVNDNATELQINLPQLSEETITISKEDLTTSEFKSLSQDENFGLVVKQLENRKAISLRDEDFINKQSFKDTKNSDWFHKYVENVSEKRIKGKAIFQGYKNSNGDFTGQFGPADNLRLGELIKVALTTGGHEESNENLNSKLKELDHWSVPYLNTGLNLELSVLTESEIEPNRFVTRGEFFLTILEATGVVQPGQIESYEVQCDYDDLNFNDLNRAEKLTIAACLLVQDGVISGTDDGFLNLDKNINRAEVAKIVIETLSKYIETSESIENELETIENLIEESESKNTEEENEEISNEEQTEEETETSTEKITYEGEYNLGGTYYLNENNNVCINAITTTSTLPEGVTAAEGAFSVEVCLTNQNSPSIFNYNLDTEVSDNCVYGNSGSFQVGNMFQEDGAYYAELDASAEASAFQEATLTCF